MMDLLGFEPRTSSVQTKRSKPIGATDPWNTGYPSFPRSFYLRQRKIAQSLSRICTTLVWATRSRRQTGIEPASNKDHNFEPGPTPDCRSAPNRSRTCTSLRTHGPQPCLSTSFSIGAESDWPKRLVRRCNSHSVQSLVPGEGFEPTQPKPLVYSQLISPMKALTLSGAAPITDRSPEMQSPEPSIPGVFHPVSTGLCQCRLGTDCPEERIAIRFVFQAPDRIRTCDLTDRSRLL